MLSLLIVTFSIFLFPVSSDLPKDENGVPLCISMIESGKLGSTHDEMAKIMRKWGIDELQQYCHWLDVTDAITHKFYQVCDPVKRMNSQKNLDYAIMNPRYFKEKRIATQLDHFLEVYAKNGIKELFEVIVAYGWKEMKEFCDDNANWRKTVGCKLADTVQVTVNNETKKLTALGSFKKFLTRSSSSSSSRGSN